MVIDAHVHLFPPEINADPARWAQAHGEAHWALLATRVRKNGRPVQTFPSLKELIGAMDQAGVNRAVLQGWYWEKAENCAKQNAFYAECIRLYPDRLAAAVTVQPLAGMEHVRAELSRAWDWGFQGVGELSPHSQGYPISHPAFEQLMRMAGQWRWPVNLHVTAPDARPYPGMVPTPLADFATLAGRFPRTDIILAHFGGLERGVKRDLRARSTYSSSSGQNADNGQARHGGRAPPFALHHNLYFDSAAAPLSYGQEVWQRFPPGRVIFGSDFPLNLYPALDAEPNLRRFVDAVRAASGLSPEELAAVLGGTANRWFAVKATI